MKKIKYNLKEILADVEKDEAASKPVHQLVSQDVISTMLKKNPPERNIDTKPPEK